MPTNILDLAREALQTVSPWEAQLRRYHEQKARTATVWAGIDERQRFVLQHRSVAPCVPARWREEE